MQSCILYMEIQQDKINAHIDSCINFIESVYIHNVIVGIPNINTQTNFVTKVCSTEIAMKLNIF